MHPGGLMAPLGGKAYGLPGWLLLLFRAALPALPGRRNGSLSPRPRAPSALYQLINSLVNLARAFFSMRET